MPPIWESLPNLLQCLKLYIYTRYSWDKTRYSCPKQIPWEIRCIHQEWDRSTQMEATHHWRPPSCWTWYGKPWEWLRIALEPTHHIKSQPPPLHRVFILSYISSSLCLSFATIGPCSSPQPTLLTWPALTFFSTRHLHILPLNDYLILS